MPLSALVKYSQWGHLRKACERPFCLTVKVEEKLIRWSKLLKSLLSQAKDFRLCHIVWMFPTPVCTLSVSHCVIYWECCQNPFQSIHCICGLRFAGGPDVQCAVVPPVSAQRRLILSVADPVSVSLPACNPTCSPAVVWTLSFWQPQRTPTHPPSNPDLTPFLHYSLLRVNGVLCVSTATLSSMKA